ncbi:phosphoribosylanthranilate isomerase [Chryseobacterium sp. JUb7]|uniref:phosphoribosylanthranilate isomerase n=1 Tax=Chryseobacterium sp. JUb7 TaxID=2940599 RepID=UPI00216AA24C|nr:phosphoribosylanthranilate isomerase [Chryseobacterium sp. JUb7]MCS3532224.1 phosphoribosylanthranilate isomerase [Chryseobacterium sp. JUb7]
MNDKTSTNKQQLKVCGLTVLDQIHELILMKVDFLGFIFYKKSPRYVLNYLHYEDISKIGHRGKVGVFVNETIQQIIEIALKANLNYVQLHGDENEDFIAELRENLDPEIGIIKVIRIGNQRPKIESLITKNISYLLFDTDSKAFGGTGKQFDWNILNTIEIPLPYFLSGGISEENSPDIHLLKQKPLVLDINSKFETSPGNKNINKIRRFKEIMRE